jgi:hypothetical protein
VFKATRTSIKQTIRNIGMAQAYGVYSVSQTLTGEQWLDRVAEAENMESKALELIAEGEAIIAGTGDYSTQSRIGWAVDQLKALFED